MFCRRLQRDLTDSTVSRNFGVRNWEQSKAKQNKTKQSKTKQNKNKNEASRSCKRKLQRGLVSSSSLHQAHQRRCLVARGFAPVPHWQVPMGHTIVAIKSMTKAFSKMNVRKHTQPCHAHGARPRPLRLVPRCRPPSLPARPLLSLAPLTSCSASAQGRPRAHASCAFACSRPPPPCRLSCAAPSQVNAAQLDKDLEQNWAVVAEVRSTQAG